MRRAAAVLPSVLLTVLLALVAQPAHARKPHKVEIGIGAAGMMNATFMSGLSEDKKRVKIQGQDDAVVAYPGFWGISGGGGVQASALYYGIIGLELDLLYSHDKGKGKVTQEEFTQEANRTITSTSNDGEVTMSQGAFHIPLLVKAAIPLKTVRPFILLGPEFVLPGSGTIDSPFANIQPEADNGPYVNLMTGVGAEFLLPIAGVDLRIPFSLRGAFNFGTGPNVTDRVTLGDYVQNLNTFYYEKMDTKWEYQAFFMLGVAWYQYVD